MARLCRGGGIAVGLLLFGMAPAYAYLDPGSVSLAVQALVASVAGVMLTAKYWFWRLKELLGFGKKKPADEDAEDTDGQ